MTTSSGQASTNATQDSSQSSKNRPVSTGVETLSSRPPTTLAPDCIIAERATLIGKHRVTIAAGAIVHPFACIDSTYGPVEIGERCLIWERAVVGGGSAVGSRKDQTEEVSTRIVLAEDVEIKSGVTVEAGATIGAHTEIDVGAMVEANATIGEWCRVAPRCTVSHNGRLQDYTIVLGSDTGTWRRQDVQRKGNTRLKEMSTQAHARHVEALHRMIKGVNAKWT
ncbi:MAG: hypothetical protein M1828_002260 [Chrysothrix sp. TS-e1954]|nr:MAG: hypothetical protein M1828_002260 [Chrysothrix sp. TS-e1954]